MVLVLLVKKNIFLLISASSLSDIFIENIKTNIEHPKIHSKGTQYLNIPLSPVVLPL